MRAVEAVLPHFAEASANDKDLAKMKPPSSISAQQRQQMLALMPDLKPRAQTVWQLVDGAAAIFAARPLKLDDKAAKLLDAEAKGHIAALVARFSAMTAWEAKALEDDVRAYAEAGGHKLGKIAQPLRAALTGMSVSPPIFALMAVLGREESLARLGRSGVRECKLEVIHRDRMERLNGRSGPELAGVEGDPSRCLQSPRGLCPPLDTPSPQVSSSGSV